MRVVCKIILIMGGVWLLLIAAMVARAHDLNPAGYSWIAFTSWRDGRIGLYRILPDGSEIQRLTHGALDYSPAWSPDARWVAFVSVRDAVPEARIFRMRADGTTITHVTDLPGLQPAWSPDGCWIALNFYNQLYLVNLRDGRQHEITRSTALSIMPDWSPDGRWLAYIQESQGNRQIYKIRADGSTPQPVSPVLLSLDGPRWSPDGRWIVFSAFDGNRHQLYRIHPDGREMRQITFDNADHLEPDWSPDGQWIVFTGYASGNADLYRIRLDGSGQQQLTTHPANDAEAAWSPAIKATLHIRPLAGLALVLLGSLLAIVTGRRPLVTRR